MTASSTLATFNRFCSCHIQTLFNIEAFTKPISTTFHQNNTAFSSWELALGQVGQEVRGFKNAPAGLLNPDQHCEGARGQGEIV